MADENIRGDTQKKQQTLQDNEQLSDIILFLDKMDFYCKRYQNSTKTEI